MPSRNRISDSKRDKIYNRWLEIDNATTVAKEFGIHRNTVYKIIKEHKNECIKCSNDAVHRKQYCEKCLEKNRQRKKQRTISQLKKGLCILCDNPISPKHSRLCEYHRIKQNEHSKDYRERKKKNRKSPAKGSKVWRKEKLTRLKSRYNKDAADLIKEQNWSCAICNRKFKDIVLHLHHIDGDNKNNCKDNFIFLCFDCHNTYETINNHPNLNKLLDWINSTYPNLLP